MPGDEITREKGEKEKSSKPLRTRASWMARKLGVPLSARPMRPRSASAGARPGPHSTSWGKVSEWYDAHLSTDDTFQEAVIWPNLKRLLALKPNETVADIACGQGFFSEKLFNEGVSVTGVDISPELIAKAVARTEPLTKTSEHRLEFIVASADKLTMGDASVDKAIIILALQNIESAKAVVAECNRILKPGGTLSLVLNHPAFRIPHASAWGWDSEQLIQYRRLDSYLTEGKDSIKMHPGSDPSVSTMSFHRPFAYYIKALVRQGLLVSNCEEWTSHRKSDSGPRAKAENIARQEFPMFLYLEGKKV